MLHAFFGQACRLRRDGVTHQIDRPVGIRNAPELLGIRLSHSDLLALNAARLTAELGPLPA